MATKHKSLQPLNVVMDSKNWRALRAHLLTQGRNVQEVFTAYAWKLLEDAQKKADRQAAKEL